MKVDWLVDKVLKAAVDRVAPAKGKPGLRTRLKAKASLYKAVRAPNTV
jgi:hypothetical protein